MATANPMYAAKLVTRFSWTCVDREIQGRYSQGIPAGEKN
jgi:hypothetical protein